MARTAIHPGEHLAEELKALGMSAAALSRDINVPVNRITGIINGTRAITADTAIRLGHGFGTSAEFWLNLQKLYELRRAHADVGAAVERLPSGHSGDLTSEPSGQLERYDEHMGDVVEFYPKR